MKKLLLLAFIASSFSAQAAFVANSVSDSFCGKTFSYSDREFRPLCFTISTTTSLPTLIVEGVEVDLNSPEAQERLQAELNGDIEPVLLNQLKEIQGE